MSSAGVAASGAGRPLPGRLVDLGTREYAEIWRMQQGWLAARQRDEIPDTLVLCEHPDVITLGRGTRRENLVDTDGVPVFEIERGGDVTYHGPGQLVGYPIVRLRDGEHDLHRYLRNLEQALIRTLADFGLDGLRRSGWTGVWLGDRKVASIGVAVKRWVTMHGFALNVSTDLGRFARIHPCGLPAAVMTSMSEARGQLVPLPEVAAAAAGHLGEVLGRDFTAGR